MHKVLEPQQLLRSKGEAWTDSSWVPGGGPEGNICKLYGPTRHWSIHTNKDHPVVKQAMSGWPGRNCQYLGLSSKVGLVPDGWAEGFSSRMAGLQGKLLARRLQEEGLEQAKETRPVLGPVYVLGSMSQALPPAGHGSGASQPSSPHPPQWVGTPLLPSAGDSTNPPCFSHNISQREKDGTIG